MCMWLWPILWLKARSWLLVARHASIWSISISMVLSIMMSRVITACLAWSGISNSVSSYLSHLDSRWIEPGSYTLHFPLNPIITGICWLLVLQPTLVSVPKSLIWPVWSRVLWLVHPSGWLLKASLAKSTAPKWIFGNWCILSQTSEEWRMLIYFVHLLFSSCAFATHTDSCTIMMTSNCLQGHHFLLYVVCVGWFCLFVNL